MKTNIINEYQVEYNFDTFAEMYQKVHDMSWRIQGEKLSEFIYRGVSDSKYELVPNALRKINHSTADILEYSYISKLKSNFQNRDIIQAEFIELLKFYKSAKYHGLEVPHLKIFENALFCDTDVLPFFVTEKIDEWYAPELQDFVALAQHYGLKTCLLDWTRDINVAFFFALRNLLDECIKNEGKVGDGDACIWLLNMQKLSLYSSVIENSENKICIPLKYFVPSYNINSNAILQKGVLTYVAFESSQFLMPYKTVSINAIINDYLLQFNRKIMRNSSDGVVLCKLLFPKQDFVKAMQYVSESGYNSATLYSGFEGAKLKLEEDNWIKKLL